MIDSETGAGSSSLAAAADLAVHFTGIWKALGHAKADVNRLIESDTSIAPLVRLSRRTPLTRRCARSEEAS